MVRFSLLDLYRYMGLVLGFQLPGTISNFLPDSLRRWLYVYGIGVSNVLIVGNTKKSIEIAEAIANTAATGQNVLGIVGIDSKDFKSFEDFPDALNAITQPIHGIIQTELYKDQAKNDTVLRFAQVNHASYRFVPGNSDLFVGNIQVELFAGQIPMIAVHQTALIGWGRIAKRIFDLILSTIGLILLSPVLLLIAILVKLTDFRGPVFMRGTAQRRLTRHNNVFKVYKFRSHYAKYDGKTDKQVFEMIGKPELLEEYRKERRPAGQ
jgi:hypothetical protein